MPLQNRVDPFGQLHAHPAHGGFMGNRGGRFHDPATRTLTGRHWASKNWIICVCEFKGRQRNIWGIQKNGGPSYTELFFLDEVTALAAGHRPCFECRREAAKAYAQAFGEALGVHTPRIKEMDDRLHRERLAVNNAARMLSGQDVAALPEGVMIASGRQPHALRGGLALLWSFTGYGAALPLARLEGPLTLITPPTTVAVLRAGFEPVWHPSAQASVD